MRVFITGMGICCPIGSTLDEVTQALREGRSGIREIESFDYSRMTMRHAGEVIEIPDTGRFPQDLYRVWDRGTRMAMHAATAALADANLLDDEAALDRMGIVIGTSGSGQYQNARFQIDGSLKVDEELVFYLSRNAPHYQCAQVAANFGIHGPHLAIGAATAGSGIALAVAMSWLRTGKVDRVLVGGSESFSLLNVLGFDQLGLTKPEPCTPFSGQPGMTFGEGAGYLVLETEANAKRHQQSCWAELKSVAIRADGFDPILFDPSGAGQARAMTAAIEAAGCQPDEIDWVRASGTGGRDQDLAETIAIKSAFPVAPPVSSLEPYLGHANGAGPAIGLVAAVLCMRHQFIPATIGFTEPRPGCDLDYVTTGHRHQRLHNILCNTAAFGGVNTAIVVGNVAFEDASLLTASKIPVVHCSGNSTSDEHADQVTDADTVISGVGVVSPYGCGTLEVMDGCFHQSSAWSQDERLKGTEFAELRCGFVQGFSPREHCPSVKLRGLELLTQYSAGATSLALKHARVDRGGLQPERTGMVTGITRSSGAVFERLFSELSLNGFRPMVGRLMLRNGRFMVASQLANWFDLRGYTSTLSLGIGCGAHAIIAANDQLRLDPSLDAIVVVAVDELSAFNLRTLRSAKLLEENADAWSINRLDGERYLPGEAAVAMVIERRSHCERRGGTALASIAGTATSFDGLPGASRLQISRRPTWEAAESQGTYLERCYRAACKQAKIQPHEIDVIYGHRTGVAAWDQKELAAVERVFDEGQPRVSVQAGTGICEATGALLNLAAAIRTLQIGQLPNSATTAATSVYQRALISVASEQGHNAAIVITAPQTIAAEASSNTVVAP